MKYRGRVSGIILSMIFTMAMILGGCGEKSQDVDAAMAPNVETQVSEITVEPTIEETVELSETIITEEPIVPVEAVAEVEIPTEYAAVVTISINPSFQLYLDSNNVVLACIGVNEDAEKMLAEKPDAFQGKSLNQTIETIVEESIEQGLLTEEKDNTVSIEVTEVADATYVEQVKETLVQAQNAAKTFMEEKEIPNAVEISVSEELAAVVDMEEPIEDNTVIIVGDPLASTETPAQEQTQVSVAPGVCPECGGTGFTCPTCGKHAYESCFCCKGTGYQTCTNCLGSKLQRCQGCKGKGTDEFGNVCTYCNGSGQFTCEVCNGAGGYTCSRCYGFTYACPTCEYAVQYCKSCGGSGKSGQ